MKTVAFQGELGAYSEQAIYHYFGQTVSAQPFESFEQILQAVLDKQADYAMLPVENALTGTVIQAYDQLLSTTLTIQAEVILPIHHCLMANHGTSLDQIEFAQSHPQALGQCAKNLQTLKLKPFNFYDTAGAAKDLHENPKPNHAAIASELSASTYNLTILKRNFEDQAYNQTRFFVMGTQPIDQIKADKTSLVFCAVHKPNALAKILAIFAKYNINLYKIESRPMPGKPWQYVFFLDVEGDAHENPLNQAINLAKSQTSWMTCLGTYTKST